MRRYDLAIVGAGPVGLEAAAGAVAGGLNVVLLERGLLAQHLADWGHVRLFTPFELNAGPAGRAALGSGGRALPEPGALLTGREFREEYLLPLAAALDDRVTILSRHRVLSISRGSLLKGEALGLTTRAESPFRLLYEGPDGEAEVLAEQVFDCSGTYGQPNWAGPGGTPARGERGLRTSIEYGLPDVLGTDRSRYRGVRTLVLGGGHSAATTVLSLATLAAQGPETRFSWATRRSESPPLVAIPEDPLPERESLVARAGTLAGAPPTGSEWLGGAQLLEIARDGEEFTARLAVDGGERESRFGAVVANVGYEPDDRLYRQLQIHECYASRAPMKLAAALLSSAGDGPPDCLTLGGFGPDTLENPEPGFFILGAKSYGKHPAFLLKTGYEQVRDALGMALANGQINAV